MSYFLVHILASWDKLILTRKDLIFTDDVVQDYHAYGDTHDHGRQHLDTDQEQLLSMPYGVFSTVWGYNV